jgi:Domain of unknown function (DUF6458)
VGIAISLIVIAVGAVLTFAVKNDAHNVNLDVVGWILMAVGAVGFLLTLAFWSTWWGPGYFRRTRYVEGDPYAYGPRRGYGRRQRVIEEDEQPPPY